MKIVRGLDFGLPELWSIYGHECSSDPADSNTRCPGVHKLTASCGGAAQRTKSCFHCSRVYWTSAGAEFKADTNSRQTLRLRSCSHGPPNVCSLSAAGRTVMRDASTDIINVVRRLQPFM